MAVPTNLAADFAAEAVPEATAYLAKEIPKAILVASAKAYAATHGLGAGAIVGLVSAAIGYAYSMTSKARSGPNLRRRRPKGVKRLALGSPADVGAAQGEPVSVSSTKSAPKNTRRPDIIGSGLEVVERPLRLQRTLKGDTPKSVWSSLRDLTTGKKTLKSNFCFKMTSARDLRGLMAIPIRHDGNLAMNDGNWVVGAQSIATVSASGDFKQHKTMLKQPNQVNYTGVPPTNSSNIIVPRLNLPTLEQTSWDLNNLKLFPGADLLERAENTKQFMVAPVMQLGGSAVPYPAGDGKANSLKANYPSADLSYARKQDVNVLTGDPSGGQQNPITTYELPRFKTQLGGGSLKMRMANQSMNSVVVEFVVVKVANPYGPGKVTPNSALPEDIISENATSCNMTKTWRNLFETVGTEWEKKRTSNLSYKMGNEPRSGDQLKLECLNNPYKPWLPDSCFKAHYDNQNRYSSDNNMDLAANGLYTNHIEGSAPDGIEIQATNPLAPTTQPTTQPNALVPFSNHGGSGQKTPYRVVNRGHCTISGAAERDVTIPFPGSNYDATQIQSVAQNVRKGYLIDSVTPVLMSNESFIVLISINGSLQDLIEPEIGTAGESKDGIKVIGKGYTPAIVDFYCEYKEHIYPSHCDYASIPKMSYNLGQVNDRMAEGSSASYFGKVQAMAEAVPVTQAGVLRTGANDRAGDNAGTA